MLCGKWSVNHLEATEEFRVELKATHKSVQLGS